MGTLMKNRQVVGGTPVVDTALDTQSTDVVQNKVVAEAISTINSKIGNKTEASAVSGDTAFAKINSLNNSLTTTAHFVPTYESNTTFADLKQKYMNTYGTRFCVAFAFSNVSGLPFSLEGGQCIMMRTNLSSSAFLLVFDGVNIHTARI